MAAPSPHDIRIVSISSSSSRAFVMSEVFAFVLMPFDAGFDDIYQFGIKGTASGLGIRAERVDEQIYAEGMLDRIYRQIDAAHIIIADMSGQNPNVFYEVGYAHAKNKLCILLTKDADDIPFDLKHRRHIVYNDSVLKLKDELIKDLHWALSEIEDIRKSRIRVDIKEIDGELERTQWWSKVKVSFVIDLHNDSDIPSAEIESIYFYSSKGWSVFQGDSPCPSTNSDLPQYKHRHFLTTPIKKLHSSGWAQLRFRTDRTIADKFSGDEILESYPITGHAVLRLVTDQGPFDTNVFIDIVAEEVPF